MSISIIIGGYYVHNPALDDITRLVQSPHLRIELNRPDVLTFTMPPDNVRFGKVQKRKDTVVVNIDGIEYFRGRVVDERPNIYNMREYTCEGTLSFLSDSVHRPISITGNENLTAKAHFVNLITEHNEQVEASKRFVIGTVDASEKVMQKEDTDYATTLSAIEQQLVNRYGGFLRVRRVNDINYIDWLKELTEESTQTVEFGQNIVDLDGLIDTREIGSVLIPLGARVNGKKLTIASVNNGLDYIESAELIQKYGRVVVTKDFATIKDANELLEKAREALAEMEDDETFDITAVDLSRLGVDVTALRVGLLTPIRAPRLGIDKSKILYAADMDLDAIENSVYTFGVPRQTLTEALAETARGGGRVGKKIDELSNVITDAYIEVDQMKGDIELRAYQDEMNVRFSEAWIGINGVKADLWLKADEETVDELSRTVEQAYIQINGAAADLLLKADKTDVTDLEKTVNTVSADLNAALGEIELKASIKTVNTLGERVNNAEVLIEAANSRISLKANQDYVENLETSVNQARSDASIATTNVDALGQRVGGVELILEGATGTISMHAEQIKMKANKTYVDELFAKSITTENLSSNLSNLNAIVNNSIQGNFGDFETVQAQGVVANSIVETKALTVNGLSYSAHSHEISVADDGTVTFGAVTGTPQNFNIAETKAYKDGVSAAKNSVSLASAGWISGTNTVTASNGKTFPVTLPPFEVSGGTSFDAEHKTTVFFLTESVALPLKSFPVDASSVYEAGRLDGLAEADTSAAYAEGWMAARKEVRYSISTSNKTVTIYGPGSTVDGLAKFWTFDLALGFTSHMANQSTGKATAEIYANMRMDGSTVFTKTDTSTINIGGGLM